MKPRYKATQGGMTPQIRFTKSLHPASAQIVVCNMLTMLNLPNIVALGVWLEARGLLWPEFPHRVKYNPACNTVIEAAIDAVAAQCNVPRDLIAGHIMAGAGQKRRFWLNQLSFCRAGARLYVVVRPEYRRRASPTWAEDRPA